MGQEIEHDAIFSEEEFIHFKEKLREETKILMEWFQTDTFEDKGGICGCEVEAWLLDKDANPASCNQEFLAKLGDPLVVPELSKFNFELNNTPHPVEGALLNHLSSELTQTWENCIRIAQEMEKQIGIIGILPTLDTEKLTLEAITPLRRYYALNQQVLRLRDGRPLQINIEGKDHLVEEHKDLLIESAATSLQIHLQVRPSQAVRFYNASHIISSATVALSANSPFVAGKELWEETRIPLFEQAVYLPSFRNNQGVSTGRVTFGTGYRRKSLLEPFLENLDGFPPLLPMAFEGEANELNHLRLHNGTIWRWNRPIIGINPTGKPHLRIEHRVTSAGPSIPDMVANIAFFLGLVHHFALQEIPPETQISFETVRENFYSAAKFGLKAKVCWLDGKDYLLKDLLLDQLLPAARHKLLELGLLDEEVSFYLDEIIRGRIITERNGACWQRDYIERHGPNFHEMTQAYLEQQQKNIPVHRWTI